jgi:ketosteroid isomerase-like protein
MNEQRILELEEQRFAAMVAGDVAALERLLDDALTYTHSSGAVDTKTSYIAGVRNKVWEYKSIRRDNERVVLRGDAALVFCRLHIDVLVSGTPRKVNSNALSVWARDGAGWQLLAVHSTPVAS